MKRILAIISLLIAIVMAVISCDDRALGKPDIEVTVSPDMDIAVSLDTLYYLANYANESADIMIKLTGENPHSYANRRVDVHYNTDLANVITNATATGGLRYFVTDENGMADGYVYARAIGNLQIKFTVTAFEDVTITKNIKILGPSINKIIADPAIIPADNTTLSEIKTYIKPPVSGQIIDFSINWGVLTQQSATTDVNGIATTWAKSNSEGIANITATMREYPDNPKVITIEYSNNVE